MKFIKQGANWRAIATRSFIFSVIWWVLSDGVAQSWWVGVPAVLLAMMTSMALIPPVPVVLTAIPGFVVFFFLRSLPAGADVAWRVFHPRIPIDLDLVEYQLQLPPGLAQVFLANIISLLSGTLSAGLEQDILKLHVLDKQKNFVAELKAVELRVAQMLGLSLNIGNDICDIEADPARRLF